MIKDIIGYLLTIFSYHIISVKTFSFSSFPNNSIDIFEDNLIYDKNQTFDGFDQNFVKIYRLTDGEIVTKLKFFEFNVIQTKFDDLCLRQITDQNHLIQLWYSNDDLLDCEFTTDGQSVRQFIREFNETNDKRIVAQNQTIFSHDNGSLPSVWSYLTDYSKYRQQCHRLHKKLLKQINSNPNSKSNRSELKRPKRADLLVFPGTNWCGKGSNSINFEDLGEHSFADRCCRDHDNCKYTIAPFSWKYHLFNYRFHFVSHCSCDERFRTCLKMANTGAANIVGKLFFNVIQTKCFLFRMEKVCSRRSWWGKCLKSKRKKRAFFRNPLSY